MSLTIPMSPISHLIIATTAEVYIALDNERGRFPIEQIEQNEDCIGWMRADGGGEFIDLEDTKYKKDILKSFNSHEGLLVAVYESLPATAVEEPKYLVFSKYGVSGDSLDELSKSSETLLVALR